MKIDANGSMREAGSGGDLRAGHAFNKSKNERLAVSVGERPNSVEDRMRFGTGVRGMTSGGSDWCGLCGGGFFIEFIVRPGAAMKIRSAVARDRGEPSGEVRNFTQGAKPGQRLEEDVLHEIVDIGEGNAGQQDTVNHPRVPGVEQTESRAVPTLGSANEGVVRPAGFVRRIHVRATGAGGAKLRECSHLGSMESHHVSPGRRG